MENRESARGGEGAVAGFENDSDANMTATLRIADPSTSFVRFANSLRSGTTFKGAVNGKARIAAGLGTRWSALTDAL
jgi:hypothetical protein